MGRKSTLTEEQKQLILNEYKECNNLTEISKKTGITYSLIWNYIKSIERKAKVVMNKNEKLAEQSLQQSFDAYNSLVDKIDEIEVFIKQMKDNDGNVKNGCSKDFLMAWNGITDTYKWYIDRKLKMKEMIESELFRNAILDAINHEYPTVASKIKEIIDKKRKELGVV